LAHQGYTIVTDPAKHFDTITIDVVQSGFSSADAVVAEFHKYGINLRRIDDRHVGVSFNETTTLVDLDELIEIFGDLKGLETHKQGFLSDAYYENRTLADLPDNLKRKSNFMQQPQFTEITSET
jgi:glycine dehydrogenase